MTLLARFGSTVLLLTALGGSFLQAGCMTAHYPMTANSSEERPTVNELLEYFSSISTLTNHEIKKELQHMERLYAQTQGHASAFRLSLILILPNTDVQNESKAIEILENMSFPAPYDVDYKNFSTLLKTVIRENQKNKILYQISHNRLNALIKEKNKKEVLLKETQEKLQDAINKFNKHNALFKKINQELHEKEQAVQNLQNKIEELKAIEKSINKRKNIKAPTT